MSTPLLDSSAPVGKYAVMRQATRAARFVCLHATYGEAQEEAKRLVIEAFKVRPDWDHRYYIVEIAGVFGLGPSGSHQLEL